MNAKSAAVQVLKSTRNARTVAAPASVTAASQPSPDLLAIRSGPTHRSRYLAHYNQTLAPDLLYMTYNHSVTTSPPAPPELPTWPDMGKNPFTLNRPRPKKGTALVPSAKPTTDTNLTKLESITISIHMKEAICAYSLLIKLMQAHSCVVQPIRTLSYQL